MMITREQGDRREGGLVFNGQSFTSEDEKFTMFCYRF